MQTLEALGKRIKTAQDLLSIVKTMKSLAAVNIRLYDRASVSVQEYQGIVDRAWEVFFHSTGFRMKEQPAGPGACLVIGSDQGMCGPFNEQLLAVASGEWDRLGEKGLVLPIWTCGERVSRAVEDTGRAISEHLPTPKGLSGINAQVLSVIHKIDAWRTTGRLETLYLSYNVPARTGGYSPVFQRVLPLDREWLETRTTSRWPSRCLPLMGLAQEEMFQYLFRQHLFVALYRAFAQSLAGENAARFMAMQAAEKNILEIQESLTAFFREERQTQITNELLDIVSGFEVLKEETFAV